MTEPTPHARDGALRRLRGLTIGATGTALGAVAFFGAVAAATVPGHSTTGATRSCGPARCRSTRVPGALDGPWM